MNTSDIIALIALILSGISFIKEIIFERTDRRRGLFEDTIKEYMIFKIPEARNSVELVEKRWKTRKLQEILSQFRKNLLYFKFYDKRFYEKVDGIIMQIDDFAVTMNNREDTDIWQLEKLDKYIHSLYDELTKMYFSRKWFRSR